MVSSVVESGPRYAPADSSLPAPWKALVDGKTGYLYYWNTETNSTQYEKPAPLPLPPGPLRPVSSSSGQKMGAAAGGGGTSRSSDSQTPRSSNYNGGTSQGGGGHYHSQGGGGGGAPSINSHSGFGVSPQPQPMGSSRGGYSSSGQIRGSGNPPPAQSPLVYSSRIGSGGQVQGNSLTSVIGSIHGTNNNATTSSTQPRLASIPPPRGQQGIGPQANAHSHISVGHQNNIAGPLVPSGSGPPPILRRSTNYAPDPYKRSQDQGFFEPTTTTFTDVQNYMRQNEVTVLGDNVPPPFTTFDATGFPPEIMKEFRMAGFVAPTPVQAQSWPVALQSRDIVAIAKTGSGKTLGYLLPAFLHVARIRANSKLGPSVLVLAPTRELATQIQEEAVKFGRPMRISSTCVYGGAPKGPQLRDLERGADIVIATPGRLNDYLEARKVNLRQTTYLVLDEADRMLDMGFEPQIRKIVREIPPRRQTLMYTATWPKEVRKIAEDLLVNPVHVSIGNSDELTVNKAITQLIECMPPYEKQRRLEQILQGQEPGSKILIFCSTKKMCEQLSRTLSRVFRAAAIHGDKSQSERDYVLAQFKQGRCPILVATDVAARGLDIKDIRVVINYDFPTGIEDYVHRIGRTGRAGAVGLAYTFFSEQDAKYARELVKVMERANQKIPLELRDIAARSSHLKGRSGKWGEVGGGGSRGSRDGGGRNQFGGRGGNNSFAAAWPPPMSTIGRQEKSFDKFGDRERLGDRDRRTDDGNRGRGGMGRRLGGGRGRDRSLSQSPSGGGDRSRSRSRDNLYHQSAPYIRGGSGVPRHRDVSGNQSMAAVGTLPSRQSKVEIHREVSPELVRPRGDMPLQKPLASPGDHPREDALPRIGSVFPSPVPKEEPLRVALPKDVSPKTVPVTNWVPSYDSSPGMVVDTSSCAQAEETRSAAMQGGLS